MSAIVRDLLLGEGQLGGFSQSAGRERGEKKGEHNSISVAFISGEIALADYTLSVTMALWRENKIAFVLLHNNYK